jgi:FkbM family methyltransferase
MNVMYYGQYQLDKILHETFFENIRNGFFVECGAFDGLTECTCKFFEETMGWTGLNIEPVPYAFNKLIQNRPNCINENYALSSSSQTAIFTNVIHPSLGRHFGNGSLNHTLVHKTELIDTGCKFETFEVNTIQFIDLYNKHVLPNIDLFVLDVEGCEIEALKGIICLPIDSLPKVFCIEYTISGSDEIGAMLSPYYYFHSKYTHNAFFVKRVLNDTSI